ncbi:hypothetical protein [Evansella cellulosilytica]|uniref:Uncharacterized protein n=1 Tax=Evansella cellulosilytica (strain ATCC 21833 / DSM 2522 / FERM P-1141 / JCM 9156 / N-4) TaxID=649639 RepID=E6TUU3_EVAC2|nr:hypothetical protein [Evansella cellulosilytica]ADU32095.1 hypothetical protein Bcell_3856 [Evansella cellulosilytica DSM 2522]
MGMKENGSGKKMYLLAAVIFVVGIACSIFFVITSSVFQTGERVIVPGATEIHLEEGDYTVFHEYRSVIDGKVYSTETALTGLYVRLLEKSNGSHIEMSPVRFNTNYSLNGREGEGLLSFTIEEEGTYILEGSYEEGFDEKEAIFLIKQTFLGEILFAVGTFVMSTLLSLILIILALVKRRNNKANGDGSSLPDMK